MKNASINFSSLQLEADPYPHFFLASVLHNDLESDLLNWFETTAFWQLTITDFYEQFEFSLLDVPIPDKLRDLISSCTISKLEEEIASIFSTKPLTLIGLTAHKLIDGQRIGIHNDFIGSEETHRLLIQINSNWSEDKGGFLMLFNSENVQDISKVVRPLSNSGFGFEISEKSYHAVSAISNLSRYTLVYTFKVKSNVSGQQG